MTKIVCTALGAGIGSLVGFLAGAAWTFLVMGRQERLEDEDSKYAAAARRTAPHVRVVERTWR